MSHVKAPLQTRGDVICVCLIFRQRLLIDLLKANLRPALHSCKAIYRFKLHIRHIRPLEILNGGLQPLQHRLADPLLHVKLPLTILLILKPPKMAPSLSQNDRTPSILPTMRWDLLDNRIVLARDREEWHSDASKGL